jgi:hypothetical protein
MSHVPHDPATVQAAFPRPAFGPDPAVGPREPSPAAEPVR